MAEDAKRDRTGIFAAQFIPPLPEADVERTITSALRYQPFRISYRSLIENLGITPEEQAALGIEAKPPIHDAFGNVIAENIPYHREDARKRNEKHRRRKGMKPKAEVNAARNAKVAEANRERIEPFLEKLPKGKKPNLTKIADKAGLHRNTVRKYARNTPNKSK